MTILKSPGTWLCHEIGPQVQALGSAKCALLAQRQTEVLPQARNNFCDPLEAVILYFGCEVTVNPVNADPSFEVRILRNGTTPTATISFGAMETGRKAFLLNIPITQGEFFQMERETFSPGGNVSYYYVVAGKMTGTDPNG